jgi:non-ribosomal peptide synthetase-like protein
MFGGKKGDDSGGNFKTPLLSVNSGSPKISGKKYGSVVDSFWSNSGRSHRSLSDSSRYELLKDVDVGSKNMSPNSRKWGEGPFKTLRSSFTFSNEQTKPEPYKKTHEIFQEVCDKYPDNVAIEEEGVSYSYKTINERAEAIAKKLRELQILPGSVIAIYLPRGVQVYVTMLGVMKANCSYVPIDISFPQSRVLFTLSNSGAAAIVRVEEGLPLLLHGADSANADEKVCVQQISTSMGHVVLKGTAVSESYVGTAGGIKKEMDYANAEFTIQKKVAYIIYTSGTTGQPKGVMVSVRNAAHYVKVLRTLFASAPQDRVFQGYSTAFDASFGEIWTAFGGGATLVVGTKAMMRSGADLKDHIRDLRITILDTTPTNLTIMGNGHGLDALRTVIVGGEQCTAPVVGKWQPGRRFYNMYGPTETTVSATYAELFSGKPVSIGVALPGYRISIRNELMKKVKKGEEGELCIGGKGVTLGYLNAPNKTASKFVFVDGERIYKTGDLVREDEHGSVIFIGRADSQVKIRGYRVELEDIETHLNAVEGCESAVVAVQKNKVSNAQELVAFVVCEGNKFNPSNARNYLKQSLPKFMIPNAFVKIRPGDIPHSNISGKVLRQKLPYWNTLQILVDPRLLSNVTGKGENAMPQTATEQYIVQLLLDILQVSIPIEENIFDYGFNSVSGALLVSKCRKEKDWSFVKMKDVYEHTTPKALSTYIDGCLSETKAALEGFDVGARVNTIPLLNSSNLNSFWNRPRYCVVVTLQCLVFVWFAVLLNVMILLQQYLSDNTPTWFFYLQLGLFPIFAPMLLFIQAAVVKYLIVGRFEEADYPLWSLNYFRWWLLHRLVINPLFLPGHAIAAFSMRILGANIGKSAYLGGTPFLEADLVTIGDNVTMQTDSVLQTWLIENRILKLRKVCIGDNAYIGERSVVSLGSRIGSGVVIHPLSITPQFSQVADHTEVAGSPGKPLSGSKASPLKRALSELKVSALQSGRSNCVYSFVVQTMILLLLAIQLTVVQSALVGPILLFYLYVPQFHTELSNFDAVALLKWVPALALAQQFLACSLLCVMKRLVSGSSKEESIVRLDSFEYARRFFAKYTMRLLMTGPTRGMTETVFMRSVLSLGMGMDVGEGSEIDVSNWGPKPELVTVGNNCMINGGALLGISPVYHGRMMLRRTVLEEKTFLGNMCVVPQGSVLSSNSLLGVMSCSPQQMEQGSTYLGSPSFKLPSRKEWRNVDKTKSTDLTFNPPCHVWFARLFMNTLKIVTSTTMVLLLMLFYMGVYNFVDIVYGIPETDDFLSITFLIKFGWWLLISVSSPFALVFVCAIGKWLWVCKYRPVQVPMWSCFIWRSDLAYEMEIFMRGVIRVFDGTPVMNWVYRLFGVDIGSDVFLFSATFMEHDLTHIRDGAVVTGGTLQTHLYEDRFYKTGHVHIGEGALVAPGGFALYDSHMARASSLSSNSLIMRNEKFQHHIRYFGLPAQPHQGDTDLSYSQAQKIYEETKDEYERLKNRLHESKIAVYDAKAREIDGVFEDVV